jgi:hypothetical protein
VSIVKQGLSALVLLDKLLNIPQIEPVRAALLESDYRQFPFGHAAPDGDLGDTQQPRYFVDV